MQRMKRARSDGFVWHTCNIHSHILNLATKMCLCIQFSDTMCRILPNFSIYSEHAD